MPTGVYPRQHKNLCKVHGPLTDENSYVAKQYGAGRDGQTTRKCRQCRAQGQYLRRNGHARPEPTDEWEYWERILTAHGLSMWRGEHQPEGLRLIRYMPLKPYKNLSAESQWVVNQPWHPELSGGYVVMQLDSQY